MTKIKNQNSDFIRHNRRIHDRVASKYDKTHSEIFNPVEQERIRDCLKYSISQIGTGASIFKTLDFGAGTGNLTRHCIGMNLDVTAADVSEKSLEIIKEKYPENDNLTVELLNGVDLSNFKSDTFDLIVTYSVLHHVPEYLAIIEEFVRVLKPNGIIYLDHERTPSFWNRSSLVYKEYENEMKVIYGETKIERLIRRIRSLFSVEAWGRLKNRKWYKIGSEGDIHVHVNDHIEWEKINQVLEKKCVLIKQEDYLVCREKCSSISVYNKYKDKCTDTRTCFYKKTK